MIIVSRRRARALACCYSVESVASTANGAGGRAGRTFGADARDAIVSAEVTGNKWIVVTGSRARTQAHAIESHVGGVRVARPAARPRSARLAFRRTGFAVVGTHITGSEGIVVSSGRARTQARAIESHVGGVRVACRATRRRSASLAFRRTGFAVVGAHITCSECVVVPGGRARTQARAVESHVRGVRVARRAARRGSTCQAQDWTLKANYFN